MTRQPRTEAVIVGLGRAIDWIKPEPGMDGPHGGHIGGVTRQRAVAAIEGAIAYILAIEDEAATPVPAPTLDVERLAAIEDVLGTLERVVTDAESQHPGGWGPDVTTVADLRDCQVILRAALAASSVPAPTLDDHAILQRELHYSTGLRLALQWALRNDGGECPADDPAGYVRAMEALLATPDTETAE